MRKLSFIVPLYNSSIWMKKCIDSLLEQDIPQEEYDIILVDDGSPDESGKIAEEYAAHNPNVVVIHQENKGASGARNTGIGVAESKYVWFVDPDDYIESNCLSRLVSKLESEELDILRFGYKLVDENYHEVPKHPSEQKNDYSSGIYVGDAFLKERMGVACYIWTFIFKLSLIKDNNIYCYEGDYFDDTPWTPRAIRAAGAIDSMPDVCYYYLQRGDSLVRSNANKEKKIQGQKFLIKELCKQREEASKEAREWYNRMLAHCTITLISLVATESRMEIDEVLDFLKQNKVRPVSLKNVTWKSFKKALVFNLSPKASILFMRAKNK